MVEDGPAKHVGQEDVQGDGRRIVFACESKGLSAGHSGENLEPLVVGEVSDHARVVRVVFDNQQRGVALLEILPIVFNAGILLRYHWIGEEDRRGEGGAVLLRQRRRGGTDVRLRHI